MFGAYYPESRMKGKNKYLKVVGIIGIIIVILIGVGYVILQSIYNGVVIKEDKKKLEDIPKYNRNESEEERDINQNIAVFGVDIDEMRTDVIFVVNLNTQTNEIKVIAVPRDTKVAWTPFQQEKMAELNKGYHEYSKITEMSAYGGISNLRYFTVNTLEDIMGLRIDHYIVVNISAFRKIVDAIGGVEVDVPRRMEYNDDYQDLHIDLQPGLQVLNGKQAEGLVRWRHNEDYSEQYAEGDVGRIETQQIFLKALAKKLLSTDTTGQLLKIINTVYSDLKTDIKFNELKTYISYANQFKLSDITFATLPGEAVREDKWYYVLDQAEVDAFMQKFLYNRDVPIKEEVSKDAGEIRATTKQQIYQPSNKVEKEETQASQEEEISEEVVTESPTPIPEVPSTPEPTDQVIEDGEEEIELGDEIQSLPEEVPSPEVESTPIPSEIVPSQNELPETNPILSNEQIPETIEPQAEEQGELEEMIPNEGLEALLEEPVIEESPVINNDEQEVEPKEDSIQINDRGVENRGE